MTCDGGEVACVLKERGRCVIGEARWATGEATPCVAGEILVARRGRRRVSSGARLKNYKNNQNNQAQMIRLLWLSWLEVQQEERA